MKDVITYPIETILVKSAPCSALLQHAALFQCDMV